MSFILRRSVIEFEIWVNIFFLELETILLQLYVSLECLTLGTLKHFLIVNIVVVIFTFGQIVVVVVVDMVTCNVSIA